MRRVCFGRDGDGFVQQLAQPDRRLQREVRQGAVAAQKARRIVIPAFQVQKDMR
jgi:hypothetical protein